MRVLTEERDDDQRPAKACPMSRRLVNRSGRSATANASPSTARGSNISAVLPDYEQPACPLSDSARRALGELSSNRATASYDSMLKDALRHVGSSVGDMHERLRAQRDRLAKQRNSRQTKGTDKSAEEERLEAHVEDLEKEVLALTEESERAVRGIIDKRAGLEDEAAVLGDMYTAAATENDETAPRGILKPYRERRDQKLEEYERMSMRERYALNNDYAGFKKLWHDAAVGEDGPPLPDASRWFRSDGQPVMNTAGGAGTSGPSMAGDEDMGQDDDIAVAREVVSTKCPLTLRDMDEPYSNRKCKHTFERAAILDYLPPRDRVQCPQTGCSQYFSKADFAKDFYLDEAMLRRIQRQKAAENQTDDDSEDDDIDGDSELAVNARTRRHSSRPRVPKREKMEVDG
ncbi:E3 SUMO-protein ligase nse2 [Paramyrothecium foliicola]|nr:E3 SUMO-protein ligase nse2 [Paramyrothecium foliicola]